ncbi:TetR/AcrR family transcriptional regulator [Clostridium lundense]|uniref:TetR/AcrR family transcriptional regulator n=1 Tax=Clostridium lundense TaxID=319475 RepID=UPI0004827A7E|nr:TetR/AcrR family transcriptional regulator [Clostridium lundense]
MKEKLETKDGSSTINNILNCAKAEFLEKGFKDASLRNIAKQAGVTTGAIYGYFKDKDDIFVTLVKDVVHGLYNLIEEIERKQNDIYDKNTKLKNEMIDAKEEHIKYINYLYDNFDVCKLLIMCSSGSSMENYMDVLIEKVLKENKEPIQFVKETSGLDEFTIHVIVECYMNAATEFIKHDIPYEIAIKQFEKMNSFFFAGWNELIK